MAKPLHTIMKQTCEMKIGERPSSVNFSKMMKNNNRGFQFCFYQFFRVADELGVAEALKIHGIFPG
jgi:hypothetical protein